MQLMVTNGTTEVTKLQRVPISSLTQSYFVAPVETTEPMFLGPQESEDTYIQP